MQLILPVFLIDKNLIRISDIHLHVIIENNKLWYQERGNLDRLIIHINSLASGGWGNNYENIISEHLLQSKFISAHSC